jgi:hypothetical protein
MCPTVRCATATNSVCSDLDFFRKQTITLIFDVIISSLLDGELSDYLNILFVLFVFVSYVSHLLFVAACCAVRVIGHLAVDSAL